MAAKDSRVDPTASLRSEPDLTPAELDSLEFEVEGGRKGAGRRAEPHPADREHGAKTRRRSKDIVNGRPFSG